MQRVLLAVLEKMPTNLRTSKLLEAFGNSQAVQTLFDGYANSCFYPVVVGAPPGIHRTRYDMIHVIWDLQ